MADKSVGELIAAQSVTQTDLFVLEQNGTAKKLTGQTLENWLVSFADGHGGIQSIVKHSTSGLKDTYRITLADTTTFDFIVTNGKAISSVEQTSEEGLTRTYTIAFNDNTSQTFTVTDGRSITNIEKTATNVLTDTYTISYNDGTTSTFTVKNGKGISSFAKVSTVGLVDTYRIEYNDGTSDEFTVTNGAKGDKGDNQYVWIKYASQKPTASSHSFGDVADNWIGIYSGASATAPTDWTQYEWFHIKGEKGDTGDPARLISSAVEYQVSDSGTIIPSGAWSASVPMVPQGKYMWTRITATFNTGSSVVSYSVSRMGMDGSGSVSSVANISPDENGNVPLTAENIGALSSNGGDMTGGINMNGQKLKGLNTPTEDDEAATKGYVVAKESVVNNFAATEEGFVADARTVKLLNDEIKGNTTPIKLSDLTPNEKISISSWSYSKVGKLCGFYAIITANQTISAEEMLFYGMDKPIFAWEFNSRYFEYVFTLKSMYVAERYGSGAVITRESIEAGQQWIVYDLFIAA